MRIVTYGPWVALLLLDGAALWAGYAARAFEQSKEVADCKAFLDAVGDSERKLGFYSDNIEELAVAVSADAEAKALHARVSSAPSLGVAMTERRDDYLRALDEVSQWAEYLQHPILRADSWDRMAMVYNYRARYATLRVTHEHISKQCHR
jgi:hypothetical protein